MALRVLDEWLAHGDAGEGDWAGLIVRLANHGELGHTGRFLLDLPALTQPFTCRPAECTPGRRGPRTRSCCADIDVSLSPREQRALSGARPRLAAFLARRDPRWQEGVPELFDEGELRRDGGRCIFAVPSAAGLRCGLHQYEVRAGLPVGTLKPLPCRLFPLVLVDLGDRKRLLTAVHAHTRGLLDTFPPRHFPCLRADAHRPALYRSLRGTIEALLGKATYDGIKAEARRHAAYLKNR